MKNRGEIMKCPKCNSEHLFEAKTQYIMNPYWWHRGEEPIFSPKYRCLDCGCEFNIEYK